MAEKQCHVANNPQEEHKEERFSFSLPQENRLEGSTARIFRVSRIRNTSILESNGVRGDNSHKCYIHRPQSKCLDPGWDGWNGNDWAAYEPLSPPV